MDIVCRTSYSRSSATTSPPAVFPDRYRPLHQFPVRASLKILACRISGKTPVQTSRTPSDRPSSTGPTPPPRHSTPASIIDTGSSHFTARWTKNQTLESFDNNQCSCRCRSNGASKAMTCLSLDRMMFRTLGGSHIMSTRKW